MIFPLVCTFPEAGLGGRVFGARLLQGPQASYCTRRILDEYTCTTVAVDRAFLKFFDIYLLLAAYFCFSLPLY